MWELTDNQLALQELARDFATREVRPVAKELDQEPGPARRFPWDVLKRASEAGLRTLALPARDGGAGADLATLCLVHEALAHADLGFATSLGRTWQASALLHADERGRARLLPRFVEEPDLLLAIAGYEADAAAPVRAERTADGWRLSGRREGVVAGAVARLLVVEAADDDGTTTCFVVEPNGRGCDVRPVDTVGRRLAPSGDVELAGLAVSERDLVGSPGKGRSVLERLAVRFAPLEAVGAVAVGRAAFDLAVDWASRRVQGGKVIAEHASVAIKLGDMRLSLEAARSLALRAALAFEHEPDEAEALALGARALSAQAASRACYDAMQVWGGMGFMREAGMEKLTRDAATFYTAAGVDAARERLGKLATGGAR